MLPFTSVVKRPGIKETPDGLSNKVDPHTAIAEQSSKRLGQAAYKDMAQ